MERNIKFKSLKNDHGMEIQTDSCSPSQYTKTVVSTDILSLRTVRLTVLCLYNVKNYLIGSHNVIFFWDIHVVLNLERRQKTRYCQCHNLCGV